MARSPGPSSLTRRPKSPDFPCSLPMEADILFHFASIDEPSGRLGLRDFAKVLDPSWRSRDEVEDSLRAAVAGAKSKSQNIAGRVLESGYSFLLGSLAGAFGAFMVYPIDLVKTRMQNQRGASPGQRLYNNSIDCFRKVVRNEGFRGFVLGVLPQLVGVAPEKAIKLTVNDLVRNASTDQEGKIWVGFEVIAGGTAGACQVVSQPLSEALEIVGGELTIFCAGLHKPTEIVKIRLQVQGEVAKSMEGAPKRSAMWIVRNLGLVGLYKGASACLLRDVPFSAIYFPTYSHLKKDLFGESPTHKLVSSSSSRAGAIAGMPAAYLTTPRDVIKTRLQVRSTQGRHHLHRSPARGEDHLEGGRLQGFLQGWAGSYPPIVAPAWIHARGVRGSRRASFLTRARRRRTEPDTGVAEAVATLKEKTAADSLYTLQETHSRPCWTSTRSLAAIPLPTRALGRSCLLLIGGGGSVIGPIRASLPFSLYMVVTANARKRVARENRERGLG